MTFPDDLNYRESQHTFAPVRNDDPKKIIWLRRVFHKPVHPVDISFPEIQDRFGF